MFCRTCQSYCNWDSHVQNELELHIDFLLVVGSPVLCPKMHLSSVNDEKDKFGALHLDSRFLITCSARCPLASTKPQLGLKLIGMVGNIEWRGRWKRGEESSIVAGSVDSVYVLRFVVVMTEPLEGVLSQTPSVHQIHLCPSLQQMGRQNVRQFTVARFDNSALCWERWTNQ